MLVGGLFKVRHVRLRFGVKADQRDANVWFPFELIADHLQRQGSLNSTRISFLQGPGLVHHQKKVDALTGIARLVAVGAGGCSGRGTVKRHKASGEEHGDQKPR